MIRANGILYYATSEKRKRFDKDRTLTTFEHLVGDYENGPNFLYDLHIEEWVDLVNKTPPHGRQERIKKLKEIEYAIHFHVWDSSTFKIFLEKTNSYLGTPFQY